MDFFDTNVLVAATVPSHLHFAQCDALLSRLSDTGGACALHTLAETYNTLTRSGHYGIPAADASRILEEIARSYKLVSLSSSEYLRTLRDVADRQLSGPVVFDALIIACARKINARHIYTNNVRHFIRLAPDLASRIRTP